MNVSYTFYTTEYMGNTIKDKASFDRVIKQVVTPKLSQFTFGRSDRDQDEYTTERLAMCACAMADVLISHTSSDGSSQVGNVTSESVGPWKVTYASLESKAETVDEIIDNELLAKARTWLANTGLLYAGVR